MSEPHHPPERLYAKTHEWVRREGDLVIVGISDHAQHEIGDVVYVELPDVGTRTQRAESCGVIESVKSVFDLYAPCDGDVAEVNPELTDQPQSINENPYEAWFIKIRVADPSQLDALFSEREYLEFIERGEEG